MADKDVALKLRVDGQEADKTVKSFKQQLREANAELVSVSEKFGATSKEAINAAKRVAQLKDAIGDAKAMADAFSPDAKFAAFSGALRGVAGGFAGVQGAMALFGSESENLQKTLLKVQAAMALSEGLNAITGSIDAFKNLGAVIKSSVVTAFSTLRGAMLATGIGALVVAVGALVTNFGGLRDKIYDLIPGLKTVSDFVGGLVQRFTDFVGITNQAERNLENLGKSTKNANAAIENRIKILEAAGGKEKEIYALRKEQIENELKLLREKGKVEGKLKDEDLQRIQDLNTQKIALELNERNRIAKQQEEDRKKAENQHKKDLEDIKRKEKEKEQARLEANKKQLDQLNERVKAAENVQNVWDNTIKKIDDDNKAFMDAQSALMEEEDKKEQDRVFKEISDKQKATQEKKRLADIEVENERQRNMHLANLAMMLSDVVGQQTIAGKALAVAASTINTYQAASEALKANYGIFGPAAQVARVLTVAAVVAQGLANVKRIVQTQVPGRAGGGGAGISIPTSATQLPTAAIAPTASPTAINQELLDRQGNAAIRAYVVDTDNVSGVERLQRVQRAARLG